MPMHTIVIIAQDDQYFKSAAKIISNQNPGCDIMRAYSMNQASVVLGRMTGDIIVSDIKDEADSILDRENEKPCEWYPNPEFTISDNGGYCEEPDDISCEARSSSLYLNHDSSKTNMHHLKKFIESHYRESNLSLDMMAKWTGLTPNYLCTLYKNIFGISIFRFIKKLRLEEAAKLLITTELTNTEIAEMVGYKYPSYFCAQFKDYYNTSPNAYRKMQQYK